ncbi:MAG: sigma-70 family RNA polymerase sigma factor [Puniceicoccales bacterium]|jgi:RNA polymerase sigma-70 factor (ECF subfamily)|nr:sigma-70 family RNA polymerase sigma factor [Puniceicoccales bacterium]
MDFAGSGCCSRDERVINQLDLDDAKLVERVRDHDTAAFDILVKKYRGRLYSVIYNLTSNKDDAFDLTQDVLIKTFRSIDKFNGKSTFFTWLYRIAVNTAISFIRKNRLRRFFSFEKIQEDGAEAACIDSFLLDKNQGERSVFLNELQENLNIALQKLSNKHRVVVVLYEIEGLGHAEIASILKCSVGTVRSRLHYAKEQLKVFLKDYVE